MLSVEVFQVWRTRAQQWSLYIKWRSISARRKGRSTPCLRGSLRMRQERTTGSYLPLLVQGRHLEGKSEIVRGATEIRVKAGLRRREKSGQRARWGVKNSVMKRAPAQQRRWELIAPEKRGPRWKKGKEGPLAVINWRDPTRQKWLIFRPWWIPKIRIRKKRNRICPGVNRRRGREA